jgi:5-methylcytosine-specific restriction protein A
MQRGSSSTRGYDNKWRITRDRFLTAHPTCELCGEKATIPHHIVPKHEDGSDDEANLLAVCAKCHRKLDANAAGKLNKQKDKRNNSIMDKGIKISTETPFQNRSGN